MKFSWRDIVLIRREKKSASEEMSVSAARSDNDIQTH